MRDKASLLRDVLNLNLPRIGATSALALALKARTQLDEEA